MGLETTKYSDRIVPRISLHNFHSRLDEITQQLVQAAEDVGFFCVTDHGISILEIESMFSTSADFFRLPDDIKATVPWSSKNVGWEKNAQIRPSTGTPDMKDNMKDSWISELHFPEFKREALAFMHRAQEVSEQLMICFARGLGFPDDFFVKAHDISRPNSQTCARLLHYFPVDPAEPVPDGYFRAGAHTDWSLLTLLFQRAGESGLEICPGREAVTTFGMGDSWTKVEPVPGEIVCNIGDMLMSWSDDRFKSTFHRVKAPSDPERDYYGPRYSIGFFCQPSKDCVIQGPLKKYPETTGEDFIQSRISRNFAALQAKKEALAKAPVTQNTREITV